MSCQSPVNIETPQQLIEKVGRACNSHGTVMQMGVFCHEDRPSSVFWIVHMERGARRAAKAMEAELIGGSVCKLEPLPQGFHCQGRDAAGLKFQSCNVCSPTPEGLSGHIRGQPGNPSD